MENTDNKENVIVKYSSYTEAQKKATQKYRNNNRDKVNEQRKKYYKERCESDPNFLEYKRLKAKEYYLRKKTKVDFIDEPEVPAHVIEEVVNMVVVEPIPIIEEVVVPEVEEVKPKKTRKSKKTEIKEVVPVVIPDVIPEPVVEPTPVIEVKTKRVSRSTAKHTNKK